MLSGYPGTIAVGDVLETEPGNMASSISDVQQVIASDSSATFSNFDPDSPRVWTIPIVEVWVVNGRSEVRVVGFAQFFIEGIQKKSGKAEIKGRFIQRTVNGTIGEGVAEKGTYGVKLISTP